MFRNCRAGLERKKGELKRKRQAWTKNTKTWNKGGTSKGRNVRETKWKGANSRTKNWLIETKRAGLELKGNTWRERDGLKTKGHVEHKIASSTSQHHRCYALRCPVVLSMVDLSLQDLLFTSETSFMLCSTVFSSSLKHRWCYILGSSILMVAVTASDLNWPLEHVTASSRFFQNQNQTLIHALWKVWTMSQQHATSTSSYTIMNRVDAATMKPQDPNPLFQHVSSKNQSRVLRWWMLSLWQTYIFSLRLWTTYPSTEIISGGSPVHTFSESPGAHCSIQCVHFVSFQGLVAKNSKNIFKDISRFAKADGNLQGAAPSNENFIHMIRIETRSFCWHCNILELETLFQTFPEHFLISKRQRLRDKISTLLQTKQRYQRSLSGKQFGDETSGKTNLLSEKKELTTANPGSLQIRAL